MIHISNNASPLRVQTAKLSVLIAGLALVSVANAADFNFNVASGDFNTAGNWVDATTFLPTGAPTSADNAFIRNGGTLNVSSNIIAKEIRIGARQSVTPPDYNSDTLINSPDYVMWRKGLLPLANDNTAATIGPEDYRLWRRLFGGTNADNDIGGAGTLMWTGGEISGPPTGFHTGGPILRVGRHVNLSASQLTEYDFPGIVVQNGATAKIILSVPDAKLNIGDDGTTPTPLNSYTLQNGTIGLAIGGSGIDGANGNDGIAVKNGFFTMTGGQIIDATPDDLRAGTLTTQRFLTIGNQSGDSSGTPGTENYAKATLTGGVIDVLGGIRMATSPNSRGYLTINGPIVITTGGDTSIGYNATNGVGEMNMSAGTFNVGRTYTDPVSGTVNNLTGRLHVGDRGRGTLNMSGGTLNVTKELRVGGQYAAGGSVINQTGGTITTPALLMGIASDDPQAPGYLGATILIDSPTASFTQSGPNGTVLGYQGKATFEIRQGTALLAGQGSTVQVGNKATSEAVINVKGGKLTLGGTVTRSNLSSVAPVIKLTGGTLEWNNTTTTSAQGFHADLTNEGTTLVTKPNALVQVTLGRRAQITPPLDPIASNFSMTSGSWNIDIGLHSVLGADWFNASAGTASLTGGTLNINYLTGFTPAFGEVFRILRGGLGTTLGSVTIAGAGAGNWVLQEKPITTDVVNWPLDEEIQLKYVGSGAGSGGGLGGADSAVPEPTSVALVVLAMLGLLNTRGSRARTKAQQN